ncbi:MAG: alpha/beta hydrolase [Bacilli bacterium]|nr:alpha/beta hydrolase [Bacilli bacterium]
MKYALITVAVLAIAILLPILVIILIEHFTKRKWKLWVKAVIVVFSAITISLSTVFTYLSIYYGASSEVDASFEDSEKVKVSETSDYYLFDHKTNTDKAIIFYGGAKVEEKAYGPLMRMISEEGVDVYLIKMPFRFALLDTDKADKVFSESTYPSLYLMGHSLGGTTLSMYLSGAPSPYKGIIFLASYPSKAIDSYFNVISIYGSNDKVLNKEEYEKNKANFPSNYKEVVIEGGNHGYFGNYGEQKGDGEASISRNEQQRQTKDAIVPLL